MAETSNSISFLIIFRFSFLWDNIMQTFHFNIVFGVFFTEDSQHPKFSWTKKIFWQSRCEKTATSKRFALCKSLSVRPYHPETSKKLTNNTQETNYNPDSSSGFWSEGPTDASSAAKSGSGSSGSSAFISLESSKVHRETKSSARPLLKYLFCTITSSSSRHCE